MASPANQGGARAPTIPCSCGAAGTKADEEVRMQLGPERLYMDPKLYKAASEGDEEIFKQLLRAEAPDDQHEASGTSFLLGVKYSGDTALHVATHFRKIEMIKKICDVCTSLDKRQCQVGDPPTLCGSSG
jgi:hypothetical protein